VKYSGWDALKDLLGALGPIMIAIPWLRDFFYRCRRRDVSGVPVSGSLVRLKEAITASLRDKIDSPKMSDFIWTVLGLLLIFLSFLISFVRGVGDLID
jgi:hypothetical protein